MELYRRCRPQSFDEVIGQEQAVKLLQSKLEEEEKLPHVILLTGPTGSGKTTLAYLIAQSLGCNMSVTNFTEINAAETRGIDSIREMVSTMEMAPMGGTARIWLFDEIVQWPKATQQASLTYLEQCPKHCWVIFCTSETTGLLPTFLGRCFVVGLKALNEDAIKTVLVNAVTTIDADLSITPALLRLITAKSEGNARKALQLLEAALSSSDMDEQLNIVGLSSIKEEEKVKFLADDLMARERWPIIVKILDGIKDNDMEGMRKQLLAYACKVLANGSPQNQSQAKLLIESFRYGWIESGRAGMYSAAWDCCHRKG